MFWLWPSLGRRWWLYGLLWLRWRCLGGFDADLVRYDADLLRTKANFFRDLRSSPVWVRLMAFANTLAIGDWLRWWCDGWFRQQRLCLAIRRVTRRGHSGRWYWPMLVSSEAG